MISQKHCHVPSMADWRGHIIVTLKVKLNHLRLGNWSKLIIKLCHGYQIDNTTKANHNKCILHDFPLPHHVLGSKKSNVLIFSLSKGKGAKACCMHFILHSEINNVQWIINERSEEEKFEMYYILRRKSMRENLGY